MAAAPASAATARLISWAVAAPVAVAMATADVDVRDPVSVGLLTVVAAPVVDEVEFQPVGCAEDEVTLAWANVRVLVMVKVVEYEEVTVTVVSPVQSPGGRSAKATGASSRATAAVMDVKRIVTK